MKKSKAFFVMLAMSVILVLPLVGCVNQHPEAEDGESNTSSEKKVVTTSVAIMEILDRLEYDLVGVPNSDNADYPERYADVERIGMPMSPDIELLHSLSPDLILSPKSLESDLQPKYEAAQLDYSFMDLRSLDGMHDSIREVGEMLEREDQAQVIIDEYEDCLAQYQKQIEGKDSPRVLILMGLPGSYTVATENSYVGSLLKQAGATNVYEDEAEEFINVSTEDMLARDPDIIFRTSHALPDTVMKMFAEEFETNDIWQHFSAVQEGKVYDLENEEFGMSANFYFQNALQTAYGYLYEEQ